MNQHATKMGGSAYTTPDARHYSPGDRFTAHLGTVQKARVA
jgi:hypothetical protein